MSRWSDMMRELARRDAEREASRQRSAKVRAGVLIDVPESPIMQACRRHLDRFFRTHPDPATQESAMKVLRFLAVADVPLRGKPEGWAAGIIYALAKRGGRLLGVPGFLNAEFERFFGVSMGTVYKRAAHVERAIRI